MQAGPVYPSEQGTALGIDAGDDPHPSAGVDPRGAMPGGGGGHQQDSSAA
jgi:hypothetical protein